MFMHNAVFGSGGDPVFSDPHTNCIIHTHAHHRCGQFGESCGKCSTVNTMLLHVCVFEFETWGDEALSSVLESIMMIHLLEACPLCSLGSIGCYCCYLSLRVIELRWMILAD